MNISQDKQGGQLDKNFLFYLPSLCSYLSDIKLQNRQNQAEIPLLENFVDLN